MIISAQEFTIIKSYISSSEYRVMKVPVRSMKVAHALLKINPPTAGKHPVRKIHRPIINRLNVIKIIHRLELRTPIGQEKSLAHRIETRVLAAAARIVLIILIKEIMMTKRMIDTERIAKNQLQRKTMIIPVTNRNHFLGKDHGLRILMMDHLILEVGLQS